MLRWTYSFAVGTALACVALVFGAGARQRNNAPAAVRDLFAPSGKANVLVFVMSDCPISNGYATDIQRICASSRSRGVSCTLVYEDLSIDEAGVRKHGHEFGYRDIGTVIDRDRSLAQRAGATVTPEAALVEPGGAVKYRGRIDNRYVAIGKSRQVVTVHDLRDAIDAIVAGRPVAQSQTEAFGCFIPPRRYTP